MGTNRRERRIIWLERRSTQEKILQEKTFLSTHSSKIKIHVKLYTTNEQFLSSQVYSKYKAIYYLLPFQTPSHTFLRDLINKISYTLSHIHPSVSSINSVVLS